MEKFTYEKMYHNQNTFWWYVARRKIIKKTITGLKLNTDRILELGSGTAGNVELLESLGKYTGLEKEPLAIQLSRKKFTNSTFIACDIPDDLKKIDQQYDLIALLDVIEHIEDDVKTIGQLKPLLKKNGSIIITTPAHPFLWSYHDETHHHFRRYSKKTLCHLATANGFEIHYHSYFNCFLFPIIVLLRFYHKIRQDRTTDDTPISTPLNSLLTKIFASEACVIPAMRLPFGVSHVMILKKIT